MGKSCSEWGCESGVVVVIIVIGIVDPDGEGGAVNSGCRGKVRCDAVGVAIVVIFVVIGVGVAVMGKSCSECSCRGAVVGGLRSCVRGVFGWFGGEKGCVVVGVGSCSSSQKLARIWSQQVARALSSFGTSSR